MKLTNFLPVFWINLDKATERRQRMEKLFDKYKIQNTRISATDTSSSKCIMNTRFTLAEHACTISHLRAMQYALTKTDLEVFAIFEDDVEFTFNDYISYDWPEFYESLKSDWSVVQLACTSKPGYKLTEKLVKITNLNRRFCSAAYIITREAAKTLVDTYWKDGMWNLRISVPTSDAIITSLPNSYSIPMFSYTTDHSYIHPNHLESHKKEKNKQVEMWKSIINSNHIECVTQSN